ncbi:MAG: SDR family oxidoreductase [Rhodothermales bacterium]|nr:SDR family oxidoreductase [Rhodothermales bacterium]
MSDSLAETVVVVTGAGGRLGQRMAEGFAAHGATLAAVGRDAARTPFPAGAAGQPFGADMTDEEAVAALFAEVTDTLGAPGAVIHTVGTWAGDSLLATSLADFRKLVDLNLTSAFLCFREAARHMRGGRLIAFASAQGADRGRAEQYGYSAAKAGVVRLVEAAAEEFDGTGLTAHAIAPSTILYEEDGEGVEAADLVDLALYLCTDAGAALNGATLRAYG